MFCPYALHRAVLIVFILLFYSCWKQDSVLAEDERDLWESATIDMMSEEEDGIVGGVSGWIVRTPSYRSKELTELCAKLQFFYLTNYNVYWLC